MTNIYRHRFTVRCPVNGAVISYELELAACAPVMVEDLVEACRIDEGFHEDIADRLLARFGGVQVLRAHHHGVDIETRRGAGLRWSQWHYLHAVHSRPFKDHVHGHAWKVRAAKPAFPLTDAREFNLAIAEALAPLKGANLNDALGEEAATDEGLAAWLKARLSPLGVLQVEVDRYEVGSVVV